MFVRPRPRPKLLLRGRGQGQNFGLGVGLNITGQSVWDGRTDDVSRQHYNAAWLKRNGHIRRCFRRQMSSRKEATRITRLGARGTMMVSASTTALSVLTTTSLARKLTPSSPGHVTRTCWFRRPRDRALMASGGCRSAGIGLCNSGNGELCRLVLSGIVRRRWRGCGVLRSTKNWENEGLVANGPGGRATYHSITALGAASRGKNRRSL